MEYTKGEWFLYSAWHGPHAYLAALKEDYKAIFFDQYTIGM